MKKIYLCGGIKDLTDTEAGAWREKATLKLMSDRFKVLNPMRRNFRDIEFQSQNEIVQLDKNDIINNDVLLVDGTKSGSWGTAMEVLFAYEHHKVVVVFTEGDFSKTSPWLSFHATRICKTMDEAILYILKL